MSKETIYLASEDLVIFNEEMANKNGNVKTVEVDDLPEKEGHSKVLKWNYEEGTAWYEHVKIPLSPEQEVEQLNSRLEATEQALVQILMEGMM